MPLTSLSPPAPSSNLAPPTASISSKKMRQAFFVLNGQQSQSRQEKVCQTLPSQRVLAPFWRPRRHTSEPVLSQSPYRKDKMNVLQSSMARSPDEAGVGPVRNSPSTEGLAGSWGAIQQDSLGRLYSQVDKALWVEKRSLHNLR